MKNMKGQAAMEYLMTYGWAILAIVIVIAALIFMNPFGITEMCTFEQAGFTCNEPPPQLYVDSSGNLLMNVKVWNQIGQPITIKKVMCTSAPGTEVPEQGAMAVSMPPVQTGASATFTGGTQGQNSINCVNADGAQIQSSAGQSFRGKLVIWYNYENDLDTNVQHQIKATVSSKVTQLG
ncbi:MAG: hypothetical protein NTY83_03980 [Candidatus Micrarchaeota archaeon]|nr:hypothetical protein [Candidatus Micrarchaeota archaeon]